MLYFVVVVLISASKTYAEDNFFVEKPSDQTVLIGSNVTLRCAAHSYFIKSGQVTSQWLDNSLALLGESVKDILYLHDGRYSYISKTQSEKHLFIRSVTVDDNGCFECQMNYIRSQDSFSHPYRSKACITVLVPPIDVVLAEPYRDQGVIEVKENMEFSVTCESRYSKPAATLSWFKDSELIKDVKTWYEENDNKTFTAFAKLVWIPKRRDNQQKFVCRSKYVGQEQEREDLVRVAVNVLYPSGKPVVLVKGKSGPIKEGDNVTLRCSVTGGNPQPKLQWYSGNQLIGANYFYESKTQETINDLSMVVSAQHNLAVFECRSFNSFSEEPLKTKLHLSVQYFNSSIALEGVETLRINDTKRYTCSSGPANPPSVIDLLVNNQKVAAFEPEANGVSNGTAAKFIDITPEKYDLDNNKMVIVCSVYNGIGRAEERREITVFSPPESVRFLDVKETPMENSKVSYTCVSSGGYPLSNLTFYLGHQKLESVHDDGGGKVKATVTLHLNRSMNGQKICCEVTNKALDHPLVTEYNLNVYFPPSDVKIKDVEHFFVADTKGKLICNAGSSNPKAEIIWFFFNESGSEVHKGKSDLSGFKVKDTLEFTPTAAMNGTKVKCSARSNQWKEVNSSEIILIVHYAPVILNSREEIRVRENETFETGFMFDANPPISSVIWKKNGNLFLNNFNNHSSFKVKDNNLVSKSLRASDSGNYELNLANTIGMTNFTFSLVVEHSAKIWSISRDVTVQTGEKVVLACVAVGVPQFPNMVEWYHKGKRLTDGVVNIGDVQKNLTFLASDDMSGTFNCSASNGIGDIDYKEVRVLVRKKPVILYARQFRRAAGEVGKAVQLSCHASGVPSLKFLWYFMNSEIRNNSEYSVTTNNTNYPDCKSTLTVKKLNRFHYNRSFQCVVMNNMGRASLTIEVGLPTEPEIPIGLKQLNSSMTSVSVEWEPGFDGGSEQHFEVRYQSLKDGNFSSFNTSCPAVIIKDLTPAERYEVSVRSRNKDGRTSHFSSLIVFTRDSKNEDMQMVMQKASSFSTLLVILLSIGVSSLLVINCMLFCCMHRRQKRKKIQEKTEMVRNLPAGKGDARAVHMYGALMNTENGCRPDSANTNRSELVYEKASEDEQSMRTIIEVNPNGCVEEIGSNGCYGRGCVVEYDYESNLYPDMIRPSMVRRPVVNYTNIPYPDSFGEEMSPAASISYSPGIISRHSVDAPLLGSPRRQPFIRSSDGTQNHNLQFLNNNSALMSTFVRSQPGPLLTAPLNYANIDGELV